MVPHGGIPEPEENNQAELLINCQLTMWNRVGNYPGHKKSGEYS